MDPSFLEKFVLPTLASTVAGVIVVVIGAVLINRQEIGLKRGIFWMVTMVLTFGTVAFFVVRAIGTKAEVGPYRPLEKGSTEKQTEATTPPPPRDPEEHPAVAAEKMAGADAFVEKYAVKPAASPGSGSRWAVLIASHEPSDFPALNSAVAEVLTEKDHKKVAVFRPSLLENGNFEQLYASDPELIRRLHEYCDGIVVGKVSSALSKDQALGDLFTDTMSVEIRILSTTSGAVESEFKISENGAGFSSSQAQEQAEERLAKKLKNRLKIAVR
jgi:hypothetical protein